MNITPEMVEHVSAQAYRTHKYITQADNQNWLRHEEINLNTQDDETQQLWRSLTVATITSDLTNTGKASKNDRTYRNGQAVYTAYHLLTGTPAKDWDELNFSQRTTWQQVASSITHTLSLAIWDNENPLPQY